MSSSRTWWDWRELEMINRCYTLEFMRYLRNVTLGEIAICYGCLICVAAREREG